MSGNDTIPLGEGVQSLVRVGCAVASGDAVRIREALAEARERADPLAVEETLIQSYLFLGYPAALNALSMWREVSGRPAPPPRDDRQEWLSRGQEVCASVYGGVYDALRENVRRIHPDMDRWMVEEGYGKVLGRPGLDLKSRELCIAGLLAVMRVPRQLHAHLRGAVNVGARPEEVEAVLDIAGEYAEPGAAQVARETWAGVLARLREKEGA
ncbi:MAG: carboxymuconolactone decarboxylase family protein [Gemmatimonadota bacterium]